MSSTRESVLSLRLTGGMNYHDSGAAYPLDDGQWHIQNNMRIARDDLKQIDLLVLKGAVPGSLKTIYELIVINSGNPTERLFVGLSANGVYQIRPYDPPNSVLLSLADGTFPVLTDERFAKALYNNTIWFSNSRTPILSTDGTRVTSYVDVPAARHLEVFFDHLFAADVTYKGETTPWRFMWSHLYDFSAFGPTAENEADHYDVVEGCPTSVLDLRITGMKRLSDLLVVYTPSAIAVVRYVGLPKVIRVDNVLEGVGNSFVYSLVSNGITHYFWDEESHDFYEFSGKGLNAFGAEIRERLLGFPLSSREAMYGFVVKDQSEVRWTVGATSYVWNWEKRKWYEFFHQGQSVPTCVGPKIGKRAKTIDELGATTIDALGAVTIDSLSDTGETDIRRLFGSTSNKILSIKTSVGETAVTSIAPELHTGDRFYGDLYSEKETDAITIHAKYGTNCTGIGVFLSTRHNFADAVVYTSLGTWTTTTPDKRLTFPKQHGRIFRWKFVPQGVNPEGVTFFAFQEHVYGGKAER